MAYRLTVRRGPRVSRERFDDLGAAIEAMRLASHKLPVATRVVVRDGAKEA